MKLKERGKNTSTVEILSVSPHGIWLYANGGEYLLSYEDFPWFKDAKISDIYAVKLHHSHHLEWKMLDIDIHLDSLKSPENFPLKYR